MSKKPSYPLYANVSGVKYKREEPTTRNEPTFYDTVTNKMPQPSRGIHSNVNYCEKSNNVYSNNAKTGKPTYDNTRYPLYDNPKPLGKDNIIYSRPRPRPVRSNDSELQVKKPCENTQYPFYDNLKLLGKDNIRYSRPRPHPVRSNDSELQVKKPCENTQYPFYDNLKLLGKDNITYSRPRPHPVRSNNSELQVKKPYENTQYPFYDNLKLLGKDNIYSRPRPHPVRSNDPELQVKKPCENTQYPFYDNLKLLGKDNITYSRPRPRPVRSNDSELQVKKPYENTQYPFYDNLKLLGKDNITYSRPRPHPVRSNDSELQVKKPCENTQYPFYDNLKLLGKDNITYSRPRPHPVRSNDSELQVKKPCENTQYPFYDNLKLLGKDNITYSRPRPHPVRSNDSELRKAVSYEDDAIYFDNSSSQASKMYDSIYEPNNAVRPPTELSSSYSMSSRSQSITTREHETEVDSLTDFLVNSMFFNDGKKSLDRNASYLGWNCTKCNKKIMEEGLGCRAMGNIYHLKCFTCTHCGGQLGGKPFYHIDNKPYCKKGYLDTLKKCSFCQIPILDRILRATGCSYHPYCFRCIVCSTLLDGIPFTIDAANQIYCIDDYHEKFAPKCSVCKFPIIPEVGQDETVRFVALDRSFHVQCYRCEDCNTLLGSEAEGRGCYPLDGHVLCKSCNAKRIQALTSTMMTEF